MANVDKFEEQQQLDKFSQWARMSNDEFIEAYKKILFNQPADGDFYFISCEILSRLKRAIIVINELDDINE